MLDSYNNNNNIAFCPKQVWIASQKKKKKKKKVSENN
jgi:hypothetical protein